MQKMPETSPKYSYSIEWDNLAVLPVSTFEHWWTKQVNDKTRNMARRAGKKGVTILQVPLDDAFIEGVWAIYNECEIRQGKRFPHYGKNLVTVSKMMATFLDRSWATLTPRPLDPPSQAVHRSIRPGRHAPSGLGFRREFFLAP